ncbi:unnamed protein product [Miscanthus lutarioriparius]|uniref:RING-type domain-containing protein n=1 Tax=Miscanthus lutarioriparius TaxID=422564 RepID=A0A811NNE3_9POAL|nr:unnamed protein product [Miscanthus lutarioriparius]
MGRKCHAAAALAIAFAAAAAAAVAADRGLSLVGAAVAPEEEEMSLFRKVANLMWRSDGNSYQHVWPPMDVGWQIVLGSLIGFFGAAFGSVGGVGGGGIFVPMLTLIIGFDPKSSTAISKCMIMGASVSTVYYNLKLKHPTLDMPVIDYDLAVLIQPMLMLGISIGVIFNVIFPDWLVTVLLIILFLGTSTKAFLKGIETWKKETIIQREAAKRLEQTAGEEAEYAPLPTGPGAAANKKILSSDEAPSLIKNIHWKEVGLLSFVWVAFLVLQVTKNYTATCSPWYWVLNLLQVPVSVGVTLYEGFGLMSGKRVLSSKGSEQTTMKFHQVVVYGLFGIAAGLVGGLLGLGGGFIMGPLFLELGIPPQVSSATATFAMMFSSSMSVVEYYLLNRFPVPYAVYFTVVAFVAALIGQHVVRKLINWLGRASLIIFILAFMIFASAISLGLPWEASGAEVQKTTFRAFQFLPYTPFREAMDQLRKQEYRPPDLQKKQGSSGGARGILRTRSATPPATTEEEKACTVCLETFLPGEQVAITPCNHMFHQGCIAPWVKGHGNCPVCRFALCERRNPNDAANEDGGMDLELLAMEAFSRFRLFSDSTPHYH